MSATDRGNRVQGENARPCPPRSPCAAAPLPSAAALGPISHAIFVLARTHRAIAGSLLRRAGLYPGQELLLMQLWDEDHQLQSELVKALGVEPPTVTKMLQRLEQQGFIARRPATHDRRAVIVSLTAHGAALHDQVEQLWADLEACTTAGMSARQCRDALRLLKRLDRNLTAAVQARALAPHCNQVTAAPCPSCDDAPDPPCPEGW